MIPLTAEFRLKSVPFAVADSNDLALWVLQLAMFSDIRQMVALFNKDAWKNTVYGIVFSLHMPLQLRAGHGFCQMGPYGCLSCETLMLTRVD